MAKLLPPDLGFDGRNPLSGDPFNLALNYGYGILYHRCERALLLVGLDPYGGFMHAPRSDNQSLVYDFAEQFRPVAVDKPLVFAEAKLEVVNGVLSRESRRAVAQVVLEALAKPHADGSSKAELGAIILCKAAQLAAYLKGTERVHPGPVEPVVARARAAKPKNFDLRFGAVCGLGGRSRFAAPRGGTGCRAAVRGSVRRGCA